MSDITLLLQQLYQNFSITTPQEFFSLLQKIISPLHFKTQNDANHLYASRGYGSPHLLFVMELPAAPFSIKNLSSYTQTLSCFLAACENIPDDRCLSLLIIPQGKTLRNFLSAKALTPDFCLIGWPCEYKNTVPLVNIGGLGRILFRVSSFTTKDGAFPEQSTAVHNLIMLLYKIKNHLLDNGNDIFSPSTLNIQKIDGRNCYGKNLPPKASAQVLIEYNNNHTPEELIKWMQNNINFTNGQFKLSSRALSVPYLSQNEEYRQILQKAVFCGENGRRPFRTYCQSMISELMKDTCPFAEFGMPIDERLHTDAFRNNLQKIYQYFLESFFAENINQQTLNF